mmetsp:Transcript_52022/g.156125  ORF Transcript_52022/g.156125 Transcript_52022/m.156125 type:complete len:88 (+) Transcript_52022:35-298(+)
MDLLKIINREKIFTNLYEKALNLHLYIPPHSSHPPGVLSGLVLENSHRIYTLFSDQAAVWPSYLRAASSSRTATRSTSSTVIYSLRR